MFAALRPAARASVRVRPTSRLLLAAAHRPEQASHLPPGANTSSVYRTQAFSTSPVAKRDIAKMTLVGRLGAMETKDGKNGRQYLKYAIATTDRRPPPREGGECHFFLVHAQRARRRALETACRQWRTAGSPSV